MSCAGIILSAGESRRMGSPKALLELRGETFLDGLIARFAEVCAPVIVVLGHRHEHIRAAIHRADQARFAINPDYSLGQLTSLQCGLRAVPAQAEGALVTLVDHPRVAASTLRALTAGPPALAAVPRFEGRRGHPVYFGRALFPEFLALPPGGQAREVVRAHAADTRFVDVDDPGILDDVDDPEAYRRLLAAS